jgi:hypothetical protein
MSQRFQRLKISLFVSNFGIEAKRVARRIQNSDESTAEPVAFPTGWDLTWDLLVF